MAVGKLMECGCCIEGQKKVLCPRMQSILRDRKRVEESRSRGSCHRDDSPDAFAHTYLHQSASSGLFESSSPPPPPTSDSSSSSISGGDWSDGSGGGGGGDWSSSTSFDSGGGGGDW